MILWLISKRITIYCGKLNKYKNPKGRQNMHTRLRSIDLEAFERYFKRVWCMHYFQMYISISKIAILSNQSFRAINSTVKPKPFDWKKEDPRMGQTINQPWWNNAKDRPIEAKKKTLRCWRGICSLSLMMRKEWQKMAALLVTTKRRMFATIFKWNLT